MNTINPYNRQQTVYLLNVPKEVADIILSFVFYDKATGESRRLHHFYMSDIVYRFKNAEDSRAIGMEEYWVNPDTDEHWHISFYNFEEDRNIQFQSISCKCCGEYILSNISPIAITCRCIHVEEDDEDDHLW